MGNERFLEIYFYGSVGLSMAAVLIAVFIWRNIHFSQGAPAHAAALLFLVLAGLVGLLLLNAVIASVIAWVRGTSMLAPVSTILHALALPAMAVFVWVSLRG